MNWFKHLSGPRRRLAGATVLATALALSGTLFAVPASAAPLGERGINIRGENVRTVHLSGGRGILNLRTSGEGRFLHNLDFVRGGRTINLFRGHLEGSRFHRFGGLGWRFGLPATTWGLLNPYLGMPFGYPYGYGLGPMAFNLGFPYGYGGLIRGSLGLGDRDWMDFRD